MNVKMEQKTNEKFEAFKSELFKWKSEHREMYNEFARYMTNCDGSMYYHIFKAVSRQMPHIAKEWELSWGDDSDETFDSIFMLVAKENISQRIADMFSEPIPDTEKKAGIKDIVRRFFGLKAKTQVKLSAPLVLSWMFYGKSFESMVNMINKQMSNSAVERADMMKCSLAVRSVIAASIRNGYRTKEDWERYFSMDKAVKSKDAGGWALQYALKDMLSETEDKPETETENVPHMTAGRKKSKENPLIDYLPSNNSEAILSCIRRFIMSHPSAMQQALPYFVLKDMQLQLPLSNGLEYSIAMTKQFPDVSELRSDHSLRQAVGKLAGKDTLMLVKDGKTQMCRYIESDEYQELLRLLRCDLVEFFHKA